MATVEFDGDVAVVIHAARRQDDLGERIAELTKAPGDPEPTPEEGAAFIAAALEFFDALDGHPMVPGPDWWAKPVPAADMESLVPPGAAWTFGTPARPAGSASGISPRPPATACSQTMSFNR
jgi:hypothetical protein